MVERRSARLQHPAHVRMTEPALKAEFAMLLQLFYCLGPRFLGYSTQFGEPHLEAVASIDVHLVGHLLERDERRRDAGRQRFDLSPVIGMDRHRARFIEPGHTPEVEQPPLLIERDRADGIAFEGADCIHL